MSGGLEMSPIVPRRGDRSTSGGEGVCHGAASVTQNVTEEELSRDHYIKPKAKRCKVGTKGIIMQSP